MELLPLVLLSVVAYFMLIRPQQQRVRAQRALISSLAVGDEVVTIGGLLATVVNLDDDVAELQTSPGVVLRFRRSAIAGKVGPATNDVLSGDVPPDPDHDPMDRA